MANTLRREFLATMGTMATASIASGFQANPAPQSATGAKQPVRLGFIGVGGRGFGVASFAQKLAAQGEAIEIVAVCDIYQPRLERASTRLKAKAYNNSADLLRDPSVDAVYIATPDRLHLPQLLEAIRAGKDVYCEKPISHWAQFDLLKAVVHENRKLNQVVQIGTQYVADSAWDKAEQLIKEGAIGKPVHAQSCFFRRGVWGEDGMPIDDPNAQAGVGLDWEAAQGDAPRRPFSVSRFFRWRMYMDYSGGPLTDTYPHLLTPLFKALAPGFPQKVVGLGGQHYFHGEREVPDTFDLIIHYPQGLTVTFLGSFVNSTGTDTLIRGSEGTMVPKGDSIVFEPQPHDPLVPDVSVKRQEVAVDSPPVLGNTTLGAHLKDFFDCVRARRQPRANLELSYMVQVPIIMAMRSFLESKVAFFDPEQESIRLG